MSERKKAFRKQNNKENAPITLTKVKKQLRGIERQLKNRRDKMPANVIVEKERALKALKTQLIDLQSNQKVKLLTQKYKLVRFFERKKALRAYKSALKHYNELEEKFKQNEDDKELKKELKKQRKKLNHCEIDLAYNANFPFDRKYISLFPKELDEDELKDENVKKGKLITDNERNTFKKEIEYKLQNSLLEVTIDDILSGNTKTDIVSGRPDEDEEAPDAAEEIEEEDEDDFFE